MTYGQAHERLDVLLDKHDLPWFEAEEKDIFLNFAVSEFVKTRYKDFELDERGRQDIRTLINTVTGSGATVILPNGSPDPNLWFVLSLKGDFDVNDAGVQKRVTKAIRPIQHDDINKISDDPFNKPANDDPSYLTYATTLQIESETAPTSWTLVYIKQPNSVDGTNNPNTSFNLPEHTHEEIVNIAARKMLFSIEKENYNLQVNEIKEQE